MKIIRDIQIEENGAFLSNIFFTNQSGKIIYRDKIDTVIGIKHPGIILGEDSWGTVWVIHNHYKIGYPEIVKLESFCEGGKIFFDERVLFYNPSVIIERAIKHWIGKKQYDWLFHNCQHFVNKVALNKNFSETIDKVSDNMLGGGLLTAILGLATGNKTLTRVGIGICTTGGIIKSL